MGILFNDEQHSYRIGRLQETPSVGRLQETLSVDGLSFINCHSDLAAAKKLARLPDVTKMDLFYTYFTITSDDHVIKFKRSYYEINKASREIVLKDDKTICKWSRTLRRTYETISFNFRTGNFYCSVLRYKGNALIQRMIRCNKFISNIYSVEMVNFILQKWPDYMPCPSDEGILQLMVKTKSNPKKLLSLILGWFIEINGIILPNIEWFDPNYLSAALYKAKRNVKKCGTKMVDWFAYMYDLPSSLVNELFSQYPKKEPHMVLFMYKIGMETRFKEGYVFPIIDIDFIWPRCFTVEIGGELNGIRDYIHTIINLFTFSKKSNIVLKGNLNLYDFNQVQSLIKELDGAYKLLNKSTFHIFKRNKPIKEKLSDGTRLLVKPILSINESEDTLAKFFDSYFKIGPFGCYLNDKLTYLAGLDKNNMLIFYSVKQGSDGYLAQKSLGIKRRIRRIIRTTNWGGGTFRVVLNKEEIEEKFPILSTII